MAASVGLAAFGALLAHGDDAVPEVFTTIVELTSISGPNRSGGVADVTHHESPDSYMEFIGTLRDGGEVSFEGNSIPNDVTHTKLETDFDAGTKRNYELSIPGSAPALKWSFAGILTALSLEFPHDGKQPVTGTIKISGKPTKA